MARMILAGIAGFLALALLAYCPWQIFELYERLGRLTPEAEQWLTLFDYLLITAVGILLCMGVIGGAWALLKSINYNHPDEVPGRGLKDEAYNHPQPR